jgi:hypothetical protein
MVKPMDGPAKADIATVATAVSRRLRVMVRFADWLLQQPSWMRAVFAQYFQFRGR